MEPKSPSKAKLPILGFFHHFRVLKLGIAIVIVLLLSLIGYYLINNPRFPTNTSYFTVVIDCGSSGTRVNVYEWMSNRNPKLPTLLHSFPNNSTTIHDRKDGCAYHCMQTEPGLDKFVGNSSGVKASLEPLIRRAEKWVPYELHKVTPIFVLATAGLRRLREAIANGVLDDIEDVVKLHKFKYKKDSIRVLSGREEAYYGWIALNYHMGVFKNSSKLPTLGLLDLGGSSLQVATETKEATANFFKSKIGSFQHQIFAKSLPDFGLNEAFDRTVVMLSHHSQAVTKGNLGIFEIGHPCLGNGFIQNYTCHGCFKNNKSSLLLFGDPNWERCKELARNATINSKLNGQKTVNLKGNRSVTRFHALSGFFAVYNLLNLKANTTNMSKIWEKGDKLCSSSLTGLTLTNTTINQKYADFLCFRVPYMVSLIENVLCVGDKDIVFGPGDVSWTLGVALVEGKEKDSLKVESIVSFFRFKRVILSPYFVFLILVVILFGVYRSQIKLPMLGRKATLFIGPKRRPV